MTSFVELNVFACQLNKSEINNMAIRLEKALEDAKRAHTTWHYEFARRDELENAISRTLVNHRRDLSEVFAHLAARKSEQEKTPSGGLLGLVDRVARDLADLLQVAKNEQAAKELLAAEIANRQANQMTELSEVVSRVEAMAHNSPMQSPTFENRRDDIQQKHTVLGHGRKNGTRTVRAATVRGSSWHD